MGKQRSRKRVACPPLGDNTHANDRANRNPCSDSPDPRSSRVSPVVDGQLCDGNCVSRHCFCKSTCPFRDSSSSSRRPLAFHRSGDKRPCFCDWGAPALPKRSLPIASYRHSRSFPSLSRQCRPVNGTLTIWAPFQERYVPSRALPLSRSPPDPLLVSAFTGAQ